MLILKKAHTLLCLYRGPFTVTASLKWNVLNRRSNSNGNRLIVDRTICVYSGGIDIPLCNYLPPVLHSFFADELNGIVLS